MAPCHAVCLLLPLQRIKHALGMPPPIQVFFRPCSFDESFTMTTCGFVLPPPSHPMPGTLPTPPPSATTSAKRWPSTAAGRRKWETTSGAPAGWGWAATLLFLNSGHPMQANWPRQCQSSALSVVPAQHCAGAPSQLLLHAAATHSSARRLACSLTCRRLPTLPCTCSSS